MNLIDSLLMEFTHEAGLTRKMLERVPDGHTDWRPHEKSMTLGRLAAHLAEIPGWVDPTLNLPGLDLSGYKPTEIGTARENLSLFDSNVEQAKGAMPGKSNQDLMVPWALSMGSRKIFEMPRIAVLRGFILNHSVHHRAQLGVYLRMLGLPLPSIYGPSADEQG